LYLKIQQSKIQTQLACSWKDRIDCIERCFGIWGGSIGVVIGG